MDPNANLAEQETVQAYLAEMAKLPAYSRPWSWSHSGMRQRLFDLRVALYEWIAKGGFEPVWANHRRAAVLFRQWQRRCGLVERGTF